MHRDVTPPTISESRDFRRRIAVNTLFTCSKNQNQPWCTSIQLRVPRNDMSYRGYSTAERANFRCNSSESGPLVLQGGVGLLSMTYHGIKLYRQTIIRSELNHGEEIDEKDQTKLQYTEIYENAIEEQQASGTDTEYFMMYPA